MDGMGDAVPVGVAWQKSAACNGYEDCVEVARLANGNVGVRNSRLPDGPMVQFTSAELAAFLDGVGKGEFDWMTS
ncbi:hypothetical protein SLAV_39005 [Streptomyces lavendulae subsp. lavendulae]|uniref:DUF397 domain-containing protein n=2 Tax=Streptomyces lavendulae TaxID=1914 RepID=A0A2K8P5I0_STRLA|nr:hypothetical protein SLAV_00385 [Streptomyces lavendulae subsp. lavendulae]ATZ29564.1 hypothetical protein SLAV_39005 [Streptomyces lavendulae subsp. lavendulae]GLW03939.1 hypothetical protein Slala05_75690 [Streptomyces lavendulae subsp. lavendulae]